MQRTAARAALRARQGSSSGCADQSPHGTH